jgi:hypothetical protein
MNTRAQPESSENPFPLFLVVLAGALGSAVQKGYEQRSNIGAKIRPRRCGVSRTFSSGVSGCPGEAFDRIELAGLD